MRENPTEQKRQNGGITKNSKNISPYGTIRLGGALPGSAKAARPPIRDLTWDIQTTILLLARAEEEARSARRTATQNRGLDDGIVRSLRRLRVHIYDILLLAVHFLTPELLWTRQSLVCTFLVLEVFWEV